jgi:hypothetical protein
MSKKNIIELILFKNKAIAAKIILSIAFIELLTLVFLTSPGKGNIRIPILTGTDQINELIYIEIIIFIISIVSCWIWHIIKKRKLLKLTRSELEILNKKNNAI